MAWFFGIDSQFVGLQESSEFAAKRLFDHTPAVTGFIPRDGKTQDTRNSKLVFQQELRARRERLSARRGVMLVLLGIVIAFCPSRAGAQLNANPATVNLNAVLSSGLTITAAPGLVNFNLVRNGTATGSSAITIITSWRLPLIFGNIVEYAYFTNPAAALTDGASDNIPSASVSGSFNGGGYTAFTGSSPMAAGSSITLFNQAFFILFTNPGTRTDTLNLQINTTGLNLPAATYTGVLHIQAQAN